MIIRRPAVVVHRPPVMVHRPDIIYHQPPVVFNTPPPAVHQPFVESHDQYVTHPVYEHVGSNLNHVGGETYSTGHHFGGDYQGFGGFGTAGGFAAGGYGAGVGYGAGADGFGAGAAGFAGDRSVFGMGEGDVVGTVPGNDATGDHIVSGGEESTRPAVTSFNGVDDGYLATGAVGNGAEGEALDGAAVKKSTKGRPKRSLLHKLNKKETVEEMTPEEDAETKKIKPKSSKKNDIVVKRPPVIYHPPPEIYHRPPIIVHRPPLVIRRPPIIYHQPPVIVHRPAVVYHQPPLVFHQPPPAVSQPILKSHDTFMMHPAAHLSHMGSMVTNAGTYVGVPEHRFMYQGGMGFFHDGEHGEAGVGGAHAGYGGGFAGHAGFAGVHGGFNGIHGGFNGVHGGYVGQGMMDAPAHGPVLGSGRDTLEGGVETAADNAADQQLPLQEGEQQAPLMEAAPGQAAPEQGAADFGGQDIPSQEQGMEREADKSSHENKISKRKFISRIKKLRNEVRSKRQEPLEPYAYRHSDVPSYDYSPYPHERRHHKTTVNVDVVGKRSIDENNNRDDDHFLF